MLLKDDSVRNMKYKAKDVRGKFGLWDNVYDRRVIRALDCNAKWEPNWKEKEAKKKAARQADKAAKILMTGGKRKEDDDVAGGGEDDDPFAEAKKKWVPTGEAIANDHLLYSKSLLVCIALCGIQKMFPLPQIAGCLLLDLRGILCSRRAGCT